MKSRHLLLAASLALGAAGLAPACATYDAPPEPSIKGLDKDLLKDPSAAIVIDFDKAFVPSSLHVKVAPYKTDVEGNLGDEDSDDKTQLNAFFIHDPGGDTGGTSKLGSDDKSITIHLKKALSVGPQYVVLVEAGLADKTGAVTKVRRRILFGYQPEEDCNAPSTVITSGTYFFMVNVTSPPLGVQIRLWADVVVDPATGAFVGQFTDAVRNPDPAHCPSDLTCDSTQVCRTLPTHECVAPSERAGTDDEYPDYIPRPGDPNGFTFETHGCVVDQAGGSAAFSTKPVDVAIANPTVTLKNTQLSASFVPDSEGVLRASGTLVADDVLLGIISSGKGAGDLVARSIPAADSPADLPKPTDSP